MTAAQLHELGVAHGDVDLYNFLLVSPPATAEPHHGSQGGGSDWGSALGKSSGGSEGSAAVGGGGSGGSTGAAATGIAPAKPKVLLLDFAGSYKCSNAAVLQEEMQKLETLIAVRHSMS
jgi:hypothetical protein